MADAAAPRELYCDAHVHLEWCDDSLIAAQELTEKRIPTLVACVTPDETLALDQALSSLHEELFAPLVGVGLHPVWVAKGLVEESDIHKACALIASHRLVSEVGLDLRPAHRNSRVQQIRVFEQLAHAAANNSASDGTARILSIHAVNAVHDVLDTLMATDATSRCHNVFHWFSGSCDELHRVLDLGMWISLGERALSTNKGREYARIALARYRLLLETDLPEPPDHPDRKPGTATTLQQSLSTAYDLLVDAVSNRPEMQPADVAHALHDAYVTLLDPAPCSTTA